MNITYCWTEPSGYLSACVSELARRPDVGVSLIAWESAAIAPFRDFHPEGVRSRILTLGERDDADAVAQAVVETRPDVVFISGWVHRPYVALLNHPALRGVRFMMGADTPLRRDLRQWLAPLKIGRLLRRIDAIVVPGERGYQLMRYWGVPEHKVSRLLYGVDYPSFAAAGDRRLSLSAWPKRFLYVGRYVRIKGIDVMVEAYRRYRSRVATPWPLEACGTGPLADALVGPGIENAGFVQPENLGDRFAEAGVFILPSESDAWGQAIVEAAASGLPVICTQGCGAGVETVRDFHNGFVVPVRDPEALCRAMVWMHEHHGGLPEMGRESQHLAAAYSAQRWADNQLAICSRLLG